MEKTPGESSTHRPRWLSLAESGELARRAVRALALAESCGLCPRRCGAARLEGVCGLCGVSGALSAPVARAVPHFGEEPPLVGTGGSGAVFFAGCGLHCAFCQNFQISHLGHSAEPAARIESLGPEGLAEKFLELQQAGCHNLNLVTAASHLPAFLLALAHAAQRGLSLPVIWNSGGYESEEALELLDGVVDIYLPDMKFGLEEDAARLVEGGDYVAVNQRTVREMFRQVEFLELDAAGVARSGLIVRHLILPGGLAGTRKVLEFLAREVSRYVHLSLMAQYFPSHRAAGIPGLGRTISTEEYDETVSLLEEFGFENGWIQQLESESSYRPDFGRDDPFRP